MATPKFNSKSPTIKRILKEASELENTPSPDYYATPASDSDLFEWHFTLRGPPTSCFAEGIYHGRIILPPTYPLRPPSFRFLTPSGRFETNREICLSISGHHEETWQPAWGIRTALVALRSFMETDAKGQLGGLEMADAGRARIAAGTKDWKCKDCGRSNGEILEERKRAAEELGAEAAQELVPKELVIGSKEDIKKVTEEAKKKQEADEQVLQSGEPLERELPEERISRADYYEPARPAQGVPQPTGTAASPTHPQSTPVAPPTAVQRNAVVARQQVSGDGVSLWVDRSIAGIVICLAIMILKMVFGL